MELPVNAQEFLVMNQKKESLPIKLLQRLKLDQTMNYKRVYATKSFVGERDYKVENRTLR